MMRILSRKKKTQWISKITPRRFWKLHGYSDMVSHLSTICFIIRAVRYSCSLGKATWYNHSVYERWWSFSHRPLRETTAPPPFCCGRIISRKFPSTWLTRSSDLNSCDIWLIRLEFLRHLVGISQGHGEQYSHRISIQP